MTYPTDYMPCPDLYAFASRKKARKFALKNYGEEPRDVPWAEGVTWITKNDSGHTVCLVVVEAENSSAAQKTALLAHECVHAAQAWADSMGEDEPGEEWLAYAVQSCMLTCLDQLGEEWITEKER